MGISVAPAPAAQALPRPGRAARLGSRAATLLLGVALVLAVVAGIGAAVGYRGEVILSGSMRPNLQVGDLVVARKVPAAHVRPGEIVSFVAPGRAGETFTHRVRSVKPLPGGRTAIETRGDANNVSEHWIAPASGTVGEVVARIPRVGLLTRWAADPTGRLVVFGLLGGLMLVAGLRWVWRS